MELEHAADELLFGDALDEHQAARKEHLAPKPHDEALDGPRVVFARFLRKPAYDDIVSFVIALAAHGAKVQGFCA